MSTMKKLAVLAVAMLVAASASAGTITIPATSVGGTNTMVLAPVIDPAPGALASFTSRAAGAAMKLGEIRKQGSMLFAVAVAGTTSTALTTNTVVEGLVTNTTIVATPITVPESGLSAADGTVYWMRVPKERKNAILKVTVGDGTVTLSTPEGGALPVTTTTVFDTEFADFKKALYATQSASTNVNSVSSIEW